MADAIKMILVMQTWCSLKHGQVLQDRAAAGKRQEKHVHRPDEWETWERGLAEMRAEIESLQGSLADAGGDGWLWSSQLDHGSMAGGDKGNKGSRDGERAFRMEVPGCSGQQGTRGDGDEWKANRPSEENKGNREDKRAFRMEVPGC